MHVCGECGQRYDVAGFCVADGRQLVPVTDPLLGTEIGRYRLARAIGEGGMGRVYLAVQPAIGSRVAIKVLSDQCSRMPDILERFFTEARAVNLINHESIVKILDLAKLDDGRPYITMEFVDGKTLSAFVPGGRAPIGGVILVMVEVLSALAAAHAIGIVHRDLKPDNILVTEEGHAKVLDFGIAKLAPGISNNNSPRTQTGAMLGTPAYMAPEQIEGSSNVDPRTDVYAAGVVLYEALTGHPPFEKATLFELMRAHLEDPPPSPRTWRPELSIELEGVILQALAKDPAHRFPSAAAMAQALQFASQSLAADEWRPLSSRSGVPTPQRGQLGIPTVVARALGHGATVAVAPESAQRDAQVPNSALRYRVAPESAQRRVPDASETVRAPEPKRSRTGLVVLALALAAIAVAVLVVALNRRGSDDVAVASGVDEPAKPVDKPKPAGEPVAPAKTEQPPKTDAPSKTEAPAPAPSRPARRPARPPDKAPDKTPEAKGSDDDLHVIPDTPPGQHGVIIQTTPVAKSMTFKLDFDPHDFDPVAYLPKARDKARQLLPDAELASFEFDPVFPDGHVDLTSRMGRDREYEFRSPSASKRPANLPTNAPFEAPCRVHLELSAAGIEARVLDSDCKAPLVRAPRCHFADVWQRALAQNVASKDLVVRVGWLFDQKWFFDTDPYSTGKGGVESFADDCH